jgi:hypothetical protein
VKRPSVEALEALWNLRRVYIHPMRGGRQLLYGDWRSPLTIVLSEMGDADRLLFTASEVRRGLSVVREQNPGIAWPRLCLDLCVEAAIHPPPFNPEACEIPWSLADLAETAGAVGMAVTAVWDATFRCRGSAQVEQCVEAIRRTVVARLPAGNRALARSPTGVAYDDPAVRRAVHRLWLGVARRAEVALTGQGNGSRLPPAGG